MSYQVEAVAESISAIPTQAAPQMREERTVNPYQPSYPKYSKGAQIGQKDIAREPKAEDAKPPEATVRLSPAAAAIARKEQMFRMKQQAVAKKEAELATREAEIAQLRGLQEKLKAKDYSGLDGLVDYNDYSQYQVNKLNGSDPVQDELRRIQEKISGMEKSAKENLNQQYEAAVQERHRAAQTLLDASPNLPRIKKLGEDGRKAIVQHVLDTWEHDSEELTVEQAAKEVEEALTEKAKKWASLLEEEKKEAQELTPEEKKPLPPLKAGLKTLTQQVTSGELKRPAKSFQHMSDQERWAEARRRAEDKLRNRP